jgi:hypothetical protein
MNEAMYTPYDNLTDEEFLQLLDKSPQTPLLASAYKRLAAAVREHDEREAILCDECSAEIYG